MFVGAGFEVVASEAIRQQTDPSLKANYERMKSRSVSTFELISEEEVESGLRALKEAAEQETDPQPIIEPMGLLVFWKL